MPLDRSLRIVAALLAAGAAVAAQTPSPTPAVPADARLEALKIEALGAVDGMATLTQQMVDQIFSFGELGFQEFETARYATDILRRHGFSVEERLSGIPTQWMASWGSGSPVISLGSDADGIPKGSQKPGVAYHDPLVEGAPGHGEGHSAGLAVNITAALAVKQIMERDGLSGTIRVWPGIAEEMVATKEFLVRDGYFKDVDVVLLAHVGTNLETGWGAAGGSGLVSVEYRFEGTSAHGASAPWRGRSALDAVELMDVGWNFRREHLRIQQRSHYVITDGGDQPNVVPPTASVWYYFREIDYPHIKALWDLGNAMAEGAALMTGTTVTSRILGSAWPQHTNKVVAEAAYANIQRVGLPSWSEADQRLARALQRELGVPEVGIPTELAPLRGPVAEEDNTGGGSNDFGHITWNVPSIRLTFPGNLPNLPGHNWANAITMATPIAHKGATVGAMAQALTVLDLLTRPELVEQAWSYFRDVQTKDVKYVHFITDRDEPAIRANAELMDRYRPEMRKYYYDPARYPTYLEQLGIAYPTVRQEP